MNTQTSHVSHLISRTHQHLWRSALPTLCILLLLLITCARPAAAQERTTGVTPMPGPGAILVLIGPDVLHPSTAGATDGWAGYNLYRKADGEADFRKLNSTPIARVDSREAFETRVGVMADFLTVMLNTRDNAETWERLQRNETRAVLLAGLDPTLREALGILWRDADTKSGVRYTYVVTRVDRSGRESERSAAASAVAGQPLRVLRGPLSPMIEANERRAVLRWQPNPADSSAFGYNVYRSMEERGTFVRMNDRPLVQMGQAGRSGSDQMKYADTSVASGRRYYYAVVSTDFAGNESPRTPVLAVDPRDTVPPFIPQNVLVRASGLGLLVTWDRVGSPDVAGYFVSRAAVADGPYTRLSEDPVPPDTGWYEDRTAQPNVQYFYRVNAVDRAGNLSLPSARGLAISENFKPPLPPQGVRATAIPAGIRIEWDANEEEDLQGYIVFRAESLDGELVQVSPLVRKDTLFYKDTDPHIDPKGAYWYLVQAINLSGALSPLSAPAISSPVAVKGPAAPTSFRGVQDVIGNRVFWGPSTDESCSGFHVQRAVEAKILTWETITREPLGRDVFSYTDRSAEAGIAYAYRIRAVSDKGVEGPPSHAVVLAMFTPPPLPPTDLMALEEVRGVVLAWTPTREARVKGYVLWRKTGREAWKRIGPSLVPVNTGTFTDDTPLRAGAVTQYAISTVGSDGREGDRSQPTVLVKR